MAVNSAEHGGVQALTVAWLRSLSVLAGSSA